MTLRQAFPKTFPMNMTSCLIGSCEDNKLQLYAEHGNSYLKLQH